MNTFLMSPRQNQGFSLVELMIAMMLGLFLIGGVISVFLSNREVYRQNENLARMQENARYAFEVVGRDVREVGGTPCWSNLPVANVLLNPTANWWSNWGEGIHGYDGAQTLPAKAIGTNATERVDGTDAVIVYNAAGNEPLKVVEHVPTSAQFKVNTTAHGIVDDDILMVCNYDHAAIFQVTSASGSNVTLVHNTGTGSIGNCSKGLGYPTICTTNGNQYTYQDGDLITKLAANAWYIGFNGRGGRSLYRIRGSSDGTSAEEYAEGVTDLQIQYLAKDASGNLPVSYVDASSITDWSRVVAVRMVFTLQSLESVGIDANPLTRTWNAVFTLRNRQL